MIPSKLRLSTKVAIVAVGLVVNVAIGRAFVYCSGADGLHYPTVTVTSQNQTVTGPERDDLVALSA